VASIRPAVSADAPRIQEIELATHAQFIAIGYDNVANDPPDPIEVLNEYANSGRSWVALSDDGEVTGYMLLDVIDGAAHIEQLTVHPDHQGSGFGKALIEQAKDWARGMGCRAVTLSTFSEVPWNRPLYEHLGFRVLADEEVGPELRAVQEHEAQKGFGPEGRVAMQLQL